MPRGYRLAIIAALGCLIAASPERHSGQADKPDAREQLTQKAIATATPIQQPPESNHPKATCQRGQYDRGNDLCAQWQAADAAQDSADWAGYTFWLGIIGAAIGGATLLAAGFAAKYARNAWLETRRSADAFVSAEVAHLVVEAERPAKAQAGYVLLKLFAVNLGRTSAVVTTISDKALESNAFVDEFGLAWPDSAIVGPGERVALRGVGQRLSASGDLFLGGKITYRTAFGESRCAYFCYYIRPIEGDDDFYADCSVAEAKGRDWPEGHHWL